MAKWFSAALDAVRSLQPKGSKEQMLNTLRKQPGVKKEEMDFLHLDELFNGEDVITVDQLQKAILNRLKDTGLANMTRSGRDQLLQLKSFREMPPATDLYAPSIETRRQGYDDPKNPELNDAQYPHHSYLVPGHPGGHKFLRADQEETLAQGGYIERVPTAGKSNLAYDYDRAGEHFPQREAYDGSEGMLNIGHTRGFTGDLVQPNKRDPIFVLDELQSDLMQGAHKERKNRRKLEELYSDTPSQKQQIIRAQAEVEAARKDLPYQKTWPELLLKDALQEAVDRDVPYFGWLDGAQQTSRYQGPYVHKLRPGMESFYDNRLVNSKLWKELGLDKPQRGNISRKGDQRFDYDGSFENSWFVKLPPEVRKRIKEQGLPLFSLGALGVYGPYQDAGALYQ